jgi:colicin import membrane protein
VNTVVWRIIATMCLTSLVAFSQGTASSKKLNAVLSISATADFVDIATREPPQFTSFTLSSPNRLVIDIIDSVSEARDAAPVSSHPMVTAVKAVPFENAASPIFRVEVLLLEDAQALVERAGTHLLVRPQLTAAGLAREASARALAKKQADKEAQAKALEEEKAKRLAAQQVAAETRQRQVTEASEARAREQAAKAAAALAVAEARANAKQEALAQQRALEEARLEAERQKLAQRKEHEAQQREALAVAAAQKAAADEAREAALAAKRQEAFAAAAAESAAAKAREDARAAQRREALAAATAAKESAAAAKALQQKQAQEAEVRARAERVAAEQRAASERAEVAARAQQEAAQKVAEEAATRVALENSRREAVAAEQEAQRQKKVDAEAARALRGAATAPTALANAPTTQPQRVAEAAVVPKTTQALTTSGGVSAEKQAARDQLEAALAATPTPSELNERTARMTFLGFQQASGVGRVSFRTSAPVKASIGENLGGEVVVTLQNCTISIPNNQRMLDASFFDTAVSLVQPHALEDNRVRVNIALKERVAYKMTQNGNEVTIAFDPM